MTAPLVILFSMDRKLLGCLLHILCWSVVKIYDVTRFLSLSLKDYVSSFVRCCGKDTIIFERIHNEICYLVRLLHI